MTVQIDQDAAFIASVRLSASRILLSANYGSIFSKEWSDCFGGAERLTDEGILNGLTKYDINAAVLVINALNAWLDAAGEGRRATLMTIMLAEQSQL